MLKRIFCLLLVFALTLCCCACAAKPQVPAERYEELPPSGIVASDVFAALQENKQTAFFRGESAGVGYTWIVRGEQIEAPRDCNLTIRVLEANKSRIKLQFANETAFDFTPSLTLSLPFSMPAQVAAVYHGGVEKENYICAASVSRDAGNALEIPTPVATGSLAIVPVMPQPAAETDLAEPLVSATVSYYEEPQTEASFAAEPQTEAAATQRRLFSLFDFLTRPAATKPAAETQASEPKTTASKQDATQPAETTTRPAATQPQAKTCTLLVECASVFAHPDELESGKREILPEDGVLLSPTTVELLPDDTAFSVLQRVCRAQGIPMEASFTPIQGSAYVEGIGNLYEFDCGPQSGWMYRVNGEYPNYSASLYSLQAGDLVEYRYTCDLGADIGGEYEKQRS